MTNKEYLDAFEAKLINELLNLCKSYNTLDNILLATEDINQRWDAIAPEYMADSVKEIADYPTVAVAWAAYLGMAVAREWDNDWEKYTRLMSYEEREFYNAYFNDNSYTDGIKQIEDAA